MDKPIRVLQATISNDRGGLTEYIRQNYAYINKENYQFDFLTYDEVIDFSAEVIECGGNIFTVPSPLKAYSYYKRLKELNDRWKYGVIHFHLSYANFVPVLLAKLAGFNTIIIHSHSTNIDEKNEWKKRVKQGIHKVGRVVINRLSAFNIACSTEAGLWMFSKIVMNDKNKYMKANNAVNTKKYAFNPAVRRIVRDGLGLSDEIAVLHVGRFSYTKNHKAVLEIFKASKSINPNMKLYLVGPIDTMNPFYIEAVTLVKEWGLEDSVVFLGAINNVAEVMQGMDVLLLPSRFEGLSIVGIEAQASGLDVYFSENISRESKIISTASFFSLDDIKCVAEEMALKKSHRKDVEAEIKQAGYEITEAIKKIEFIYEKLCVVD